jgi:pimeloyl-ACP methyl ester carboxylesterase
MTSSPAQPALLTLTRPGFRGATGDLVALDGSDVRYRVVAQHGNGELAEDTISAEPVFTDDSPAHQTDAHPSPAGPSERRVHRVESTDGVTVALHHFGGGGTPLVICHATGFNAGAYAPLAEELSSDFDVWAVDLRGHGATNAPDSGDFAWSGMAQDLLACVRAIDAGPVAAVGHSMGGASIMLAELAQPGTVSSAYLYEPIIFPATFLTNERRENPMSGPARARREIFPSRRAAYDRYRSRPPLQLLRADALAGYVQHGFDDLSPVDAQANDAPVGSVRLACRAEHEARTFECSAKLTIEEVSEMSLPITIGAGTTEPPGNPADFTPLIADAISTAKLVQYEGLGHFGPLVDPVRIAADIQAALPKQTSWPRS